MQPIPPPNNDLLTQLFTLLSELIDPQKPGAWGGIILFILGLERQTGILSRIFKALGKARIQLAATAPKPTPTNGNGNGNGNGHNAVMLAFVTTQGELLDDKIEDKYQILSERIDHVEDRQRENWNDAREALDRMSLRVSYVERQMTSINDKLDDIQSTLDELKAA